MSSDYLKPYEEAVEKGGPGFESLLWRSKEFQLVRFRVLCEVAAAGLTRPDIPASLRTLDGHVIADMGSGTADLLRWLHAQDSKYGRYIGVEGVTELAEASRQRIAKERLPEAEIIESDFAADHTIFESLANSRGVSVILFSGSLNTFDEDHAITTVRRAFDALAKGAVVFNFLSDLTKGPSTDDTGPASRFRTLRVFETLSKVSERIALRHDYLAGHDATIGLFK